MQTQIVYEIVFSPSLPELSGTQGIQVFKRPWSSRFEDCNCRVRSLLCEYQTCFGPGLRCLAADPVFLWSGPIPPTMPMLERRWHHRWLLTSRTLCENVVSGRRLAPDHQQPSQGYWLLSSSVKPRSSRQHHFEKPASSVRIRCFHCFANHHPPEKTQFRSRSLCCRCGGAVAVESGIGSRHHRRVTAALMGWRSDGLVMENQNPNIKSLEME